MDLCKVKRDLVDTISLIFLGLRGTELGPVERLTVAQEVAGSNPVVPTISPLTVQLALS